MKESRIILAITATLILGACAKKDAGTDSATATQASAGPAPLNLADVAGKWSIRAVPESGDTTPTMSVLTATADTTGWVLEFPGTGLKVPIHVTVSGDSVMQRSDVYASQRRKGVKVMTEGTWRMQDGKMVGTTIAHYQGAKDSVLRLRTEGTRIP